MNIGEWQGEEFVTPEPVEQPVTLPEADPVQLPEETPVKLPEDVPA